MADPPVDFPVLEWLVGGLGTIGAGAVAIIMRATDNLSRRLTSVEEKVDDHAIDDQQRFATKAELELLRSSLGFRLDRIEENQRTNLSTILDRLDKIIR